MLGEWIYDSQKIESQLEKIQGFYFFDMITEFESEKILRQVEKELELDFFGQRISGKIEGYEIHMGRTSLDQPIAVHSSKRILGTYYHGLFDRASFRHSFFAALAKDTGKNFIPSSDESLQTSKDKQYERLAQLLNSHLDLSWLKEYLRLEVPQR